MNMSKDKVENQLGKPKRVTSNEYGAKWYTYYNNDYDNFIMVSYLEIKSMLYIVIKMSLHLNLR